MPTTTISPTEAYESLKALKRDDESLSDVVQRLAGNETDRMKRFGSWADTGLDEEVRGYRDEPETAMDKRR